MSTTGFKKVYNREIIVAGALQNDYDKQFHQYVSANNDSDELVIIVLQLAKYNTWNHISSKL